MRQPADFVCKALSDPTCRAIFEGLARDGEQTVHALTRRAGISQPAVSTHLTILKRAKLVNRRHAGRKTHYRAAPEALEPLMDWIPSRAGWPLTRSQTLRGTE